VTFSAGITTNAPKDTSELIVKRAEKALAQAKQEGRNRTVQIEERAAGFSADGFGVTHSTTVPASADPAPLPERRT